MKNTILVIGPDSDTIAEVLKYFCPKIESISKMITIASEEMCKISLPVIDFEPQFQPLVPSPIDLFIPFETNSDKRRGYVPTWPEIFEPLRIELLYRRFKQVILDNRPVLCRKQFMQMKTFTNLRST
jgi:hypothetical protein